MKIINMKQWLYLVMAAVVMGFAACGDDPDSTDNTINPNTGKDNTTDMAVTGGVIEKTLTDWGTIVVEITGYLNLTDELKLTMGSSMEYGIEISTNEQFDTNDGVCWRERCHDGLRDDRTFVISCGLDENTKYYYRAYLSQSGYNSMKVYGHTISLTTSGIEKFLSDYKVKTPEIEDVDEHWVRFDFNGVGSGIRIAYDTERSKLTGENIKNGNVAYFSQENMQEEILEEGMTYYYCAFNIFKEQYVVMGDIKSFKTKGFGAARYVTADISYNSDEWQYTANIQTSLMNSPLADEIRGKEVKYGMRVWYDTSYTKNGYDEILASWSDLVTGDWKKYAVGSGSNYQVSVNIPFYWGTYGYNGSSKTELDGPNAEPVAIAMDYQETIDYLDDLIKRGKATEADIQFYWDRVGRVADIKNSTVRYTQGLYDYCTVLAEVFVEIDGELYVVAQKEGPVRIPTYGDIYNF